MKPGGRTSGNYEKLLSIWLEGSDAFINWFFFHIRGVLLKCCGNTLLPSTLEAEVTSAGQECF